MPTDGIGTEEAPELTQAQVTAILTAPLEAASVFLAAGPVIFDTDGSPLRVPTGAKSVEDEISWIAENELIPQAEPGFGELKLLPSTIESLKVITRYSNELARQSIVSLDAVLQRRLVADVATKLDTQLLSADSGIDDVDRLRPAGVLSYAGETVAVDGPLTLNDLLDAQAEAVGNNTDPAALRIFLRPEDWTALRKLQDTTDRYMLDPTAQAGTAPALLGMPVTVTGHLPAGNALVADMSQIVVARDMAPSVKILSERYADYDQQAIRVVARYDAQPLNAGSVVKLTGVTSGT